MRKVTRHLLGGLFLLLPLFCLAAAQSSDVVSQTRQPVRLQLNWKHQFEFAGHYAAIERGFYAQQGLDVELLEYTQEIDVVEEVVSGRADYGIYSLNLIEERLRGRPVTLLANYFKRYPLAILAQPGIASLEDLRGKRLMISGKDLDSPLMRYLFQQSGLVPGENLTVVPHRFSIKPFTSGEVDALTAYLSNEPFELIRSKRPYQVIDLATTFPALGSNYLFARESNDPTLLERHRRFVAATNEGWQYALAHPDEVIELILNKYSQRKSREALRFEAEKTRNFIMANAFPIGSIQEERIAAVADMLREMEVVSSNERLTGFLLTSTAGATVALSEAERAWLSQHPRIRVANELDWPPYDFATDGEPRGYAIDLLRLVAAKTGLQLEFVNGHSWNELLQMGREGQLDLFPAIWKTAQRETFLRFTAPYAETPHILLRRDGDERIQGIRDLNGRTLAGIQGYADVETVKQHYPAIRMLEVANINEGLRAVAYGHADAYLGTLGAVSHALRESQISGLQIVGETTLEGRLSAGAMHMAARHDLPLLASIVQKGLDAVSREERMAIQNRWLFALDTRHSEALPAAADGKMRWVELLAITLAATALLLALLLPRLLSDETLTRRIGSRGFRLVGISALVVMISLVLLLTQQTLNYHYRQTLESTRSDLQIVLKMTLDRLDHWESEQQRYLLQLGHDSKLVALTRALLALPRDAATLASAPEQKVLRRFFAALDTESHSSDFFIIHPNGTTLASPHASALGVPSLISQQHPERFRLSLTGQAILIPPIEAEHPLTKPEGNVSEDNAPLMFFAVPITASDGSVLAVLSQRLRPDEAFAELMRYGRGRHSSESYVIDHHGRLLTASRFHEQLIELGLVQRNEQTVGNFMVRDPGGDLLNGYQSSIAREQQPLTRMAQALLATAAEEQHRHRTEYRHEHPHEISSDISGYRDYRGVAVFGAWSWNAHLGLGIATEIDAAEALAGYTELRRNLILITGLTLLLAVTAVVLTLMLASRATNIMRRSQGELEGLVAERTTALAESEEKYRCLFELSQDPMWIISDGRSAMANPAAAQVLGYESCEELVNIHLSQISPPYQPDGSRSDHKAEAMIATALRQGYHRFEWWQQRKNGEQFPAEVSLTRIPFEGRTALFCIWRDISEQKASEEGLRRATAEAQEANRAKSEFLSSMSHELRTPLNAVLGFSQLLESEENLNSDQRESVQDITRAGTHLLTLINEVLDLARIESGKLELSIEPISLADLMSACHKLVEPLAQQRGITLRLEQGCFAGHRLKADYTRTKQVLLNLLSNAIKYNRDAGAVTVSCRQQQQTLRIEIRDTGPGIPRHQLDKLFEAFNRLGAESSNIEGTGIGLIITRQLVQMMGGEVGVESSVGEGSTFWFTLPWLGREDAGHSAATTAPGRPPETPQLGGRQRVLYIEDNPVNLKLVEKIIASKTELEFIAAEEPLSGIEKAIALQPNLILLDINLPTMSGYEVIKRLRETAATRAIPVVALTANAMAEDVARSEEAGFDDYLTKPIQIKAFLEVLQRYLGG